MTLLEARPDRPVRILEIGDPRARAQCIRFGIGEGTVVAAERLRLGPVVVRHANCELALGRDLARRIVVEEAPEAALPEAAVCPAGEGRVTPDRRGSESHRRGGRQTRRWRRG
ncbi:MAG: hypothetical protein Kow00129_15700 [Thermoleophilia bacterium]